MSIKQLNLKQTKIRRNDKIPNPLSKYVKYLHKYFKNVHLTCHNKIASV